MQDREGRRKNLGSFALPAKSISSHMHYSVVRNLPNKERRRIRVALYNMRNVVAESRQNLRVRIKVVMIVAFRRVGEPMYVISGNLALEKIRTNRNYY